MIYWNTTPGATFDIAVPNLYGLTSDDTTGLQLGFEVRNNVGLQQLVSAVTIDAVTPAWIVSHQVNAQELPDNAFPPEGEYTYRAILWDPVKAEEVRTLSDGIMIFGSYAANREQFDKAIQYEQYAE